MSLSEPTADTFEFIDCLPQYAPQLPFEPVAGAGFQMWIPNDSLDGRAIPDPWICPDWDVAWMRAATWLLEYGVVHVRTRRQPWAHVTFAIDLDPGKGLLIRILEDSE